MPSINNYEMDCEAFIDMLLSDDPHPKKSVNADFLSDNEMTPMELFKILMYIFTECMKKLYGDEKKQVNLDILKSHDFNHVNKYFKSFGISCNYNVNDLDYIPEKNSDQAKLNEIKMNIKTQQYYYSFWFDFI